MKIKALGTPMRILEGEKVYYMDDMTRTVREAVREHTGVHNPFDDEAHISFNDYHKWIETL